MSKVGRKSIDISGLQVTAKNELIQFKGPKASGEYHLPDQITVQIDGNVLSIVPKTDAKPSRDLNRVWGLHRALLYNKLHGAQKGFEKKIEIVGLGFKAVKSGAGLTFTLGYSHKVDFPLPKEVAVDIDKSGQKLTLHSSDKELLGQVCSNIMALRMPEPYKGIGIRLAGQAVRRKAGKTK